MLLCAVGIGSAPLIDRGELPADSITPGGTGALHRQAEFVIRWREGDLALAGHTINAAHERQLSRLAAELFAGSDVQLNFEPNGTVPGLWPATTAALLPLVAATEAATAQLSLAGVELRAVVVDETAWQRDLARYRAHLQGGLAVSADLIVVDRTHDTAALCDRAQAQHETGPINFAESTAELRQSAYPRLDRVIALARACPESRIAIIGHTDSSGPDAWNRQLSLRRAIAVSDYLRHGGIDAGRLTATGAGSDRPIADNGTRYGRSLNRRIEIKLANPDRA